MAARGARFQAARVAQFVEAEEAEAPLTCSACLGPNSHVRVVAATKLKMCPICNRPFTNFQWRPSVDSRLRHTLICHGCAEKKGSCQSCLHDIETGLEMSVRDAMDPAALAELIERRRSRTDEEELASIAQNDALLHRRFGQKICTFYAKGHCSRGDACPFRHARPDEEGGDPPPPPSSHKNARADIQETFKMGKHTSPGESALSAVKKMQSNDSFETLNSDTGVPRIKGHRSEGIPAEDSGKKEHVRRREEKSKQTADFDFSWMDD